MFKNILIIYVNIFYNTLQLNVIIRKPSNMQWSQLLSTQRFKISQNGEVVTTTTPSTIEGLDALRTDFHIDHDRVVFSGSFRRLGRKTQVHPFAKHDMTHNRLTHSVEVASVGRSIGNRVGLMLQSLGYLPEQYTPSDIGSIVQVACLAHDMGNPPFGHTGEDALRDWFRQSQNQVYLQYLSDAEKNDIQTYEGNAHSLRIVATLEMYQERGGMRLTAASIGSLLKYPWTSSHENALKRGKFNIYRTELPFIRNVTEALGLIEISENCWVRHPLSYLMEAADDICYALLDLEDAVEIGMLDALEVERVLSPMAGVSETWIAPSIRQRCAMLRGLAIGRAIENVATTFMSHHAELLSGEFKGKDLIDLTEKDVRETLHNAKELAAHQVFLHKSKVITEIASFPCIASILSLLVPAACAYTTTGNCNHYQKLALSLMSDNPIHQNDSVYSAYMKILDFVGGMTDNAAAQMAREVSGISME